MIDLQILMPLLTEMSKSSMKNEALGEIREIVKANGKNLPFEDEDFCLAYVIDARISEAKDEIEEICDGADKQLQIEHKILNSRNYGPQPSSSSPCGSLVTFQSSRLMAW